MRYLPHTEDEIASMLRTIGTAGVDDLFAGIPDDARLRRPPALPEAMPEPRLRKHMALLAERNIHTDEARSFIGGGAYKHYVPSAVAAITGRGEFLTAYTPYQAEVSQGTLQAIFEFQTMMCELTGMDIANAGNYDLSTACAEALLMARRVNGRRKALVARSVHPHYREVVQTYLGGRDYHLVEIPWDASGRMDMNFVKRELDSATGAVLVQSPNFFGVIEVMEGLGRLAKERGALFIHACAESLAYAVLPSPGEIGADIAVGEGMSLGLGLNFGGPYLGIFAARERHLRQMPGRLVGETRDRDGRRGYVLTFATREQHIRREKATSNICTNQGLMALAASVYLSLMGPEGMKKLALLNLSRREYLEGRLRRKHPKAVVFDAPRFNETVVKLSSPAMDAVVEILKDGFFAGLDLSTYYPEMENCLLVCATEANAPLDMDMLAEKLGRFL